MKKLYLHMGFHKTATSSFQATCKNNINNLENQGFIYPLFNSSGINIIETQNHSIPFYSLFCKNPKKFKVNIARKVTDIQLVHNDYLAICEKIFNMDKNVILSGESISILDKDELENFKNYLSKFCFNIIPIVIVRSPYEFQCSFTQQNVKGGQFVDFTEFYSQQSKITNISDVFPNVKFYPFGTVCAHTLGPVGFLLNEMGINCDEFQFENSNFSLNDLSIRLQNTLNLHEPRIKNGRLNNKYKQISSNYSNKFKAKFLFTEKEFDKIKIDLYKENDFFEKKLGREFCDSKIEFSDHSNILYEIACCLIDKVEEDKKNKNNMACVSTTLPERLKIREIFDQALQLTLSVATAPSMMCAQEQNFLYLLARDYFTNEGKIFDGGCFVGGCTQSFAKGLYDANWDLNDLIYVYGLDFLSNYGAKFVNSVYSTNYKENDYIGDLIKKNIDNFVGSKFSKLCLGDIFEQEYPDKIEILFLDICKAPQINHAMVQLFDRCIPGKTIVIQQDYFFPYCPWLHITMGYLSEYFELVSSVGLRTTAVFLYKKAIPKHILQKDTWASIETTAALKLFDVFLDKLQTRERFWVEAAKANYLIQFKRYDDAFKVLNYLEIVDAIHKFDKSAYIPALKKTIQNKKQTEQLCDSRNAIYSLKEQLCKTQEKIEHLTKCFMKTQIKKSRFQAITNIVLQSYLKKNAFALVNTNQLDRAEAIAQNIIANNPYMAWAYYILGKVQWQRGEQALALESLDRAITLEPNTKYFQTFKASCLKKCQKISKVS